MLPFILDSQRSEFLLMTSGTKLFHSACPNVRAARSESRLPKTSLPKLASVLVLLLIACCPFQTTCAVESNFISLPLMELQVDSGIERGMPIAWDTNQVILLRTDGSINKFEPSEIRRHQVLDQSFQPDKAIRLRGQLQQEFGTRYAVDGNGNFAIVASPERIQLWTQRFSQLERSFESYFRTRGYPLRAAEFPLVGIVFPSQSEFLNYATRNGIHLQPGIVGYYSPLTNRLYLFEMRGSPEAEREALATILHEAAHQIAFNRGLHQRLSAPPLWTLEGLASIFEAQE